METTATSAAVAVKASYKTIIELNNVLVTIPGMNDKFMKYLPEHELLVEGEIVVVPERYRRGDKINGVFLTRNFFIEKEMIALLSQEMVANVKVVEKTDHYRNDEKFLIIDIRPAKRPFCFPKAELTFAFGSPNSDGCLYSIRIPMTDRFITFKKRNRH